MAKKRKKSGKRKDKLKVKVVAAPPPPAGGGLLGGLREVLPGSTAEQLLLGVLLGAGAAYVLSDEAMRRKIVRFAVGAYADVAGALAELREEIGDARAEILAERASAPAGVAEPAG